MPEGETKGGRGTYQVPNGTEILVFNRASKSSTLITDPACIAQERRRIPIAYDTRYPHDPINLQIAMRTRKVSTTCRLSPKGSIYLDPIS